MAIEVRGNAAQTDPVGTLRANRLSPRGAAGLVNLTPRKRDKWSRFALLQVTPDTRACPRVP